jgi:hypothetical protein
LDGARWYQIILRQSPDPRDPGYSPGQAGVLVRLHHRHHVGRRRSFGIQQVSEVLAQLIAYIPSIIAAILILAALLANFLSGIVRGATGSDILASIARYAIIIYAVFAALTELGIAVQLTAPTFLVILGAIALAPFRWWSRGRASGSSSHPSTLPPEKSPIMRATS